MANGTGKPSTSRPRRGAATLGRVPVRLDRISIRNFKGIDRLELEFPRPLIESDLDVLVMGSRNGLGKTSVFESCALLLLMARDSKAILDYVRYGPTPYTNLPDLVLRAGASSLSVSGDFSIGSAQATVTLDLFRRKPPQVKTEGNEKLLDALHIKPGSPQRRQVPAVRRSNHPLLSLLGLDQEPLVLPGLLYFHSFRKVRESNPRAVHDGGGRAVTPRGTNEEAARDTGGHVQARDPAGHDGRGWAVRVDGGWTRSGPSA